MHWPTNKIDMNIDLNLQHNNEQWRRRNQQTQLCTQHFENRRTIYSYFDFGL